MRDYTNTPLQLYARDFTLKTVIDVYDSLVWTDVYCGYGDFEIKIKNEIAKLYNIKIGDYIQCFLSRKIMIVEGMSIDYGGQNEITVTYKGRSLESLLCRRIMRKTDLLDITPDEVDEGEWEKAPIRNLWDSIKYVLERTIVPNSGESGHYGLSNPQRGISLIGYTTPQFDDILEQNTPYVDFEGMSVYDYICSVLSYFGYGWSMSYNPSGVIGGPDSSISNRKVLFTVYDGVKRTYNQFTNDRVVFSTDDESTFKMNSSIDMTSYGNVAIASGPHPVFTVYDDQGEKQYVENAHIRIPTEVYNSVSGLDRYEIFVDASSVPNMDDERSTPYPLEYIVAQMRFKSIQEVRAALGGNIEYSPSVDFDPYKRYGESFYIGDLVTVMDDFGNINIARVISFSHSLDSSGYKGYPNFEVVVPIGGYRVLEQTENDSDVAREMEYGNDVRVTEQNNLSLFDDTDIT